MANTKITGLTAITEAALADVLAIVDVSDTTMAASGSTRKITASNLLKMKGVVTVAANDSDNKIGVDYQCDGTDDQTEIQAAIDAVNSAGGGVVYLLKGTYNTTSTLTIKSNVCLIGEGWTTVISLTSASAISVITNTSGSAAAPIENVVIADLKLVGTNVSASYASSAKGIYATWLVNWQIRRVWVHDTLATGIGTDFMRDCLIQGCLVTDCGRGADHTSLGGNGIGIGTQTDSGAFIERLVIDSCIVVNAGNNGIMWEQQRDASNNGFFTCSNSLCYGCGRGFRISGVDNVTIDNCQAILCDRDGLYTSDGISLAATDTVNRLSVSNFIAWGNGVSTDGSGLHLGNSDGAFDVALSNIVSVANGEHGIELNNVVTRISISNAVCRSNTLCGLRTLQSGTGAGTEVTDLTISNSTFDTNSKDGLKLDGVTRGYLSNVIIRENDRAGIALGESKNCSRLTISACDISNNGADTGEDSGERVGVLIGATSRTNARIIFDAVQAYDDQGTKTQRFGIKTAGTVNQLSISDSDLEGNDVAGFVNIGTLSENRIRHTRGWVTHNYGSESVSPGANGEATIAHGCAETPTFANVSMGGDTTNHVDVVSIDATNITVRIKDASGADVTTGSFTVYWEARV